MPMQRPMKPRGPHRRRGQNERTHEALRPELDRNDRDAWASDDPDWADWIARENEAWFEDPYGGWGPIRKTGSNRQDALPKNMKPKTREPEQQQCSICSGMLVLDAFGTAVFCDECWTRKCLDMLES